MSRRAARIAAVEVLYGADLRGANAIELAGERGDLDSYGLRLVQGVCAREAELDALIASRSVGWTTERMSPVDRNILRVATLEMLEGDVPPNAAIDEAVEITKRFSGEEAARFVNGVLNAVKQAVYGEGGVSGSDAGSGVSGAGGGSMSGGGDATDVSGGTATSSGTGDTGNGSSGAMGGD